MGPSAIPETGKCELVAYGPAGERATLYSPVGGSICDRCGSRADDVSFSVAEPDGERTNGGLCGPCLISLLREVAAARG